MVICGVNILSENGIGRPGKIQPSSRAVSKKLLSTSPQSRLALFVICIGIIAFRHQYTCASVMSNSTFPFNRVQKSSQTACHVRREPVPYRIYPGIYERTAICCIALFAKVIHLHCPVVPMNIVRHLTYHEH